MPSLPATWRHAPSPNTPTPPTPSITNCRRNSSPTSWVPTANIPAASIRRAAKRLAEAEEPGAGARPATMPTWRTARTFWSWAAAGVRCRCGWRSSYPNARITAVSNSAPQRLYIEGQARARGLTNLTVITADMNVFAPAGSFRPHRFGGDVRAYGQLAAAAGAHPHLAEAAGAAVPAHLHPSQAARCATSRATATGWRSISSPAASCRRPG